MPIIAWTASAIQGMREMFLANGFNDFASKPVNTGELVRILENWLPPKKIQTKTELLTPPQAENASERRNREIELKKELIVHFVEYNKDKDTEIREALKAGNLPLAQRMAHTLKSNAAQLGKTPLAEASEAIEHAFVDGKNNVTQEQLELFTTELKAVLADLMPQYEKIIINTKEKSLEPLDEKSTKELLIKLSPLLENRDTLCFDFIEELRRIPESGELIKLIKELNFSKAVDALCGMKGRLGIA
jgi:HPt (histidine-containing phosphotransfer) domain-containing protein